MRRVVPLCMLAFLSTHPVSAQIMVTSLPSAQLGVSPDRLPRWARGHLLFAPLARWSIGAYELDPDFTRGGLATRTTAISDFLIGGEAVFALGHRHPKRPDGTVETSELLPGRVSITLGGWYNRVGRSAFDYQFESQVSVFCSPGSGPVNFVQAASLFLPYASDFGGSLEVDMDLLEAHAGVSYGPAGVQVGWVRTSATLTSFRIANANAPCIGSLPEGVLDRASQSINRELNGYDVVTNDLTAYATYRFARRMGRGKGRTWTAAVGAGIYRGDDAGVSPSGFIATSFGVFHGVSLDASYWFIGGADPDLRTDFEQRNPRGTLFPISDRLRDFTDNASSRVTVGIGYAF